MIPIEEVALALAIENVDEVRQIVSRLHYRLVRSLITRHEFKRARALAKSRGMASTDPRYHETVLEEAHRLASERLTRRVVRL